MKLTLDINDTQATLTLPDDSGRLTMGSGKPDAKNDGVVLFLKAGHLIGIDTLPAGKQADRWLLIEPQWDLEASFLSQRISDIAVERGVVKTALLNGKVPGNLVPTVDAFLDQVETILAAIGFDQVLQKPAKKGPAKAQHRWRKELANMAFTVDYEDSQATVYWQKRNEMRIVKGAKLRAKAPKNKDGSTSLSERMGERIRGEHADAIDGTTTTADVVLKSVNEVGIFLYFAGTNGWLVLKNDKGQTIDELSVVK